MSIKVFNPHTILGSSPADLSTLELNAILTAVIQHKLVLLRRFKALDRDNLLDYCQSQVKLLSWDFGPVMEMRADKIPKNYLFTEGDVPLHWDGAFYQEPRFLLFHCIQAPDEQAGGETVFVDTETVWKSLDTDTQQRWSSYELNFTTDKIAHYGGNISRNLVNTHPETGKTILRFAEPVGEDYLNPVSVYVKEKSPLQSTAILTEISRIMRKKAHCYHHTWETGDYLIADNFSLLHGRNAFNKHSPRHLRRIQIL